MGDRLLVQNSVPVVDVPQPDGSTVPGVAISGEFTIVNQRPVSLTYDLTVQASPDYSTGDTMGDEMTFVGAAFDAENLGITIDSVVVSCRDAITPDFDIILFTGPFTAGIDNSAFGPTVGDLRNICGVIKVRAANWTSFASNGVASLTGLGLNVVLDGEDLYAQCVARGAINFVNTDAISVTLNIKRD